MNQSSRWNPWAAVALVLTLTGGLGARTATADDMDDIKEEMARLREKVEEQQARIDHLEGRTRAPAVDSGSLAQAVEHYLSIREADPSVVPLTGVTKLGSMLRVYGFLRVDAFVDDSRPQDTQIIGWILSEDPAHPSGAPRNHGDFTVHPRLTRLGMDFEGGRVEALGDAEVSGKVEVDFYGGGSQSRSLFRMRKAWVKLRWGDLSILGGQDYDIISPLYPSVNADLVMWGAGNLGDRRPQVRAEYTPSLGDAKLILQGMIGQTNAIDLKDLDSDGYRDGETSGKPTLQGRIAVQFPFLGPKPAEVGVWGHRARENPQTAVAGSGSFDSIARGIDVNFPLTDRIWVKGELWEGRNLSDVRGGVLQGVNTTTGDEISARGGFVELGVRPLDWLTLVGGVARDDPDDHDLNVGGRAENRVQYLAARMRFDPVEFGIEYLHWVTRYVSFDEGIDNRLGAYMSYRF